ncbi:ribosome recycling factor [soil metagenome]
MTNATKKDAEARMSKAITALQVELSKLRTGRAHPSLLDHIMVPYYGNATPLSQIASIVVSDSRTLLVTPWEKPMVQAIEKAIRISDLGLNPATSGEAIRVPMPSLTEERRKDIIRLAKNETENTRVAIRGIRRDANTQLKELLKTKSITEDESRKAEEAIQKLTDQAIAEAEKLLTAKETELMTI